MYENNYTKNRKMPDNKELAKASASMMGIGCMIFMIPIFAIMIGFVLLVLYAALSSV